MIRAKYTVVLKSLLDDETTKAEIDRALSTYPLYQPDKLYDLIPNRSEVNKKILNHYKYREIGFETVGRFIDELEITMNEIMPRYNELFKTVVTMAELPSPFDNVDVVETYTETKTGETTGTSSSEGESKNNTVASDTSNMQSNTNADSKSVKSTTPQNELDVPAKDIDSIGYADEINWNKNTGNDSSETTGNSESDSTTTNTGSSSSEVKTEEKIEHTYTKVGNQGVNTYAHDMNEFRTSIIDVVDQIINDNRLSALFMRVF